MRKTDNKAVYLLGWIIFTAGFWGKWMMWWFVCCLCGLRKQMDYSENSAWNFVFTHASMHALKLVWRFPRFSNENIFGCQPHECWIYVMYYQLFGGSYNLRTRSIRDMCIYTQYVFIYLKRILLLLKVHFDVLLNFMS